MSEDDTPAPDVYHRLANRIDELPVPYPRTESGVELRLLQRMFSEEEAAIALHLSAIAEPADVIARRMSEDGRRGKGTNWPDVDRLQDTLDDLARRGSIQSGVSGTNGRRVRTFGLAPLVVGMFEFQVNHLTPEYMDDFQRYLDEGFRAAVVGNRTAQLRTVPVGRAISSARAVGTYADIRAYIKESDGPFAVINCVCRQGAELRGIATPNSSTVETCLTLGKAAAGGIASGKARRLDRDGVLEILDRAEAEGHVIQPQNAQKPIFICCCDRHACEVLQNARKLPKPAEAVATTHRARVTAGACIACGLCIKRCPMDAIKLAGENAAPGRTGDYKARRDATATVDPDRCIGCGLCVSSCPNNAIDLELKRSAAAPPRSPTWMYLRMYRDRFGLLFLVKTALRRLFGRKI